MRPLRRLLSTLLLALATLLPLRSAADTLIFKDGRKLEGVIVEEDTDTVTFKIKSIVTKFKKDEIDKIVRGGNPETPKDDTEAVLREKRTTPVGNAKLDPLRAAAAKALDGIAEKRAALGVAAKKIDSQTRGYESQARKIQASEAELKKAKDRQADAEAKVKKAEAALAAAKEQTGREPGPLKQDLADASEKLASIRSTVAMAQRGYDADKKKLDDETDRFQAAAETIRPGVSALAGAFDGLDAAWAALAAEENRQAAEAAWWPAPLEASRVRMEGRVVSCDKGSLVVVVGTDLDPSKWTEEVTIAAPGFEAKPGETLLLAARRDKGGWVLEEARR